ncbi:hypothetical protein LINPERPRIM_LOCUS37945 [Linum perenne]
MTPSAEILAITTAVGLIIFAGNLPIFVHLSLYLGLDSILHSRRNHPSAFSVLYRSYSQSSSVNLTSEFRCCCQFNRILNPTQTANLAALEKPDSLTPNQIVRKAKTKTPSLLGRK